MTNSKARIQKKMHIQAALLVICFVCLGVFAYLRFRPNVTGFVIADECGPIGNSVSHSIDDIGQCENICKVNCEGEQKTYHHSVFKLGGLGCNECACFCRERFK